MVAGTLRRTVSVLEKRVSRRGLLVRAAVAASAATVAPIRYLTRPASAASLIQCAHCSPGSLCCDGWTAFCCQLPGGTNNACPPYAFVGGWWQCHYSRSSLCNPTNVRYYLDCNRRRHDRCPGGCHCGGNKCSNRRTCCNVFRYGQCNTHIGVVTEVVCRLVTCVPPCKIGCLNCNCSAAVNQLTCHHEAGCL
jgi:hypothetical protein